MLELFPHGFEEVESADGVELVAYTDPSGEERLWQMFGGASGADVEPDWEVRWRDFHKPVEVAGLWIGPPWLDPPPGALTVVIEPGQAFGTGGHATTRLCVELLAENERGSLLDIGCGSGVLAIAAAKLGFAPLTAIDVDERATLATRANAAANGVEVDTRQADVFSADLPEADVAVANITRADVAALAPRLACRRLVTSGYLAADPLEVAGYRQLRRVTAEGWAADVHER